MHKIADSPRVGSSARRTVMTIRALTNSIYLSRCRADVNQEHVKGSGLLLSYDNKRPDPFCVTPSVPSVREAWDTFWLPVPPPGYHDLLAMLKRRRLRIEGNLHPFMANLLYFKDVMAAPRARLR